MLRNMRRLLCLVDGGPNGHRRPWLNQRLLLTCAMRAFHFGPTQDESRCRPASAQRDTFRSLHFARLAVSEERRISFHSDRPLSLSLDRCRRRRRHRTKQHACGRPLENSDDDGDDKFEGAVGNATWESCSGSERVRAKGRTASALDSVWCAPSALTARWNLSRRLSPPRRCRFRTYPSSAKSYALTLRNRENGLVTRLAPK